MRSCGTAITTALIMFACQKVLASATPIPRCFEIFSPQKVWEMSDSLPGIPTFQSLRKINIAKDFTGIEPLQTNGTQLDRAFVAFAHDGTKVFIKQYRPHEAASAITEARFAQLLSDEQLGPAMIGISDDGLNRIITQFVPGIHRLASGGFKFSRRVITPDLLHRLKALRALSEAKNISFYDLQYIEGEDNKVYFIDPTWDIYEYHKPDRSVDEAIQGVESYLKSHNPDQMR